MHANAEEGILVHATMEPNCTPKWSKIIQKSTKNATKWGPGGPRERGFSQDASENGFGVIFHHFGVHFGSHLGSQRGLFGGLFFGNFRPASLIDFGSILEVILDDFGRLFGILFENGDLKDYVAKHTSE